MILESESFQDALDQIHYLDAIARQDKRIAAAGRGRARPGHKSRVTQTKVVRANVHSETQVVAVRTQQQRDVRDQLLASKSTAGEQAQRSRRARSQLDARAGEGIDRGGERARGRGRGHSRPARRGAGRDGHRLRRRQGLIWPVSGPRHEPVRLPLGTAARRHRHRRPVRHADPRGGRRERSCSPAGPAATATTPASTTAAGWRRATRTSPPTRSRRGARSSQGQVIGYVGNTGHSFGAASALRGPDQRQPRRSARLPVGP